MVSHWQIAVRFLLRFKFRAVFVFVTLAFADMMIRYTIVLVLVRQRLGPAVHCRCTCWCIDLPAGKDPPLSRHFLRFRVMVAFACDQDPAARRRLRSASEI
jgi:hypothetical protein